MAICDFCGKEIERGTGKMYVKNDGKILHFCANKCEKNMIKLGRKNTKVKWVIKKKNKGPIVKEKSVDKVEKKQNKK